MASNLLRDARQLIRLLDPVLVKRVLEAVRPGPSLAIGAAGSFPWLVGRGPSLGVLSQLNAIADPSKPAIIDRAGTVTFSELDKRSNQLTHALDELGVTPGRSIATLLRNGREFVETVFAAQKLGVQIAPLNTWAKPKELRSAVEGTDPVLVIYDAKHREQIKESVQKDVGLVAVGDRRRAARGSMAYESLLRDRPDSPQPPFTTDRGKPKIIIHTSGTSGKPKAASRGTSTKQVTSFLAMLTVVPYRRDDVILCPAPLFHSFGLLTLTVATVLGTTLVLPERFDPEETLDLMEEHRVTAASLVPVMIRRILALPASKRSDRDLSALRIVLASGSQMSPELRQDAMDLFGDVLYDLYGSTEAGWVAIATPEDIREDPKTLGKPVAGVDVAVFDENGDKVPTGETGVFHVKSDVVFEGYASGEETPGRKGYISIGDTGYVDDKGRLFVEGREDEMVVIGGENVYPAEIEETIEGLDGVEEVAVVGVPDDEYGEVLAAFVRGRVDPDRVRDACREELASFKVPKIVEVVDELPRTSTGKVVKKELIDLLKERRKGEDKRRSA
jgi:fatty-acyl-CoA synthase